MSLLLDALKKAADDKQKLSNAESVAKQDKSESASVEVISAGDDLKSNSHEPVEELTLEETTKDEPLVLSEESEGIDLDGPELTLDENINPSPVTAQQDIDKEKFVISDEGLSLLIHKTNRDIKKNHKIIIASIAIITILIMVAGGMFYYSEMQAEIASLERKHGIAMQSMHSKTNTERLPNSSDIIRNLVSDAGLDEKVQFAKKHIGNEGRPQNSLTQKSSSKKRRNVATSVLSIQKTNKADPVGEALEAAWMSYEKGRYEEAKKSYEKVLSMEANNRDALLGLGAISILNKNNAVAREIYASLLEMDPRDPIATAAIASLRSDEGSLNSDENYLLSMLKKNPEAPHLNFSLANIYALQNKWSSAQQYYFNAWQQDSDNADYIFNLAVSMDQLNKKQQALKFYKDSLLKARDKQISFSREAVQKRINDLTEL